MSVTKFQLVPFRKGKRTLEMSVLLSTIRDIWMSEDDRDFFQTKCEDSF